MRLFRVIGLRLVVSLLLLLLQGPAMLVQEVAWAGMLVTYSMERGVRRAVVETFDGEHPCALCRKAEEIRKQEHPQPGPPASDPALRRLSWGEMLPVKHIEVPQPKGLELVQSGRFLPPLALYSGDNHPPPLPPPEQV